MLNVVVEQDVAFTKQNSGPIKFLQPFFDLGNL